MEIKILEAAWILPITAPPIKNAGVLIAGAHIEAIAKSEKLPAILAGKNCVRHNYGQAIIVPGFINLHTHLEYTILQSLSVEGGLLAWLPRLMDVTAGWSQRDRLDSIQQGIKEVIAAGTTFIVDNSYDGASVRAIAQAGLRGLVGLELFGVDQSLSDRQWQRWQERLEKELEDQVVKQARKERRLDITVAPHAPYTVCPALWQQAQQWAKVNDQIVLTHLAESAAEKKWFDAAECELTQFLIEAFGRIDPDFGNSYKEKLIWKEGSKSPVEHLHKHGLLENNLLAAHAVHVNDQDIDLLKANTVAIAHCPRSNARLDCGRVPLGKLLKSGLRVGLGTDSKASNDDLDLLAEARFAINWHKEQEPALEMEPRQIIERLTIKAAACLNREHDLGSLAPGKLADIAVFALSEDKNWSESNDDPYDLLLQGRVKLQALFVNGAEIEVFN